MRATLATLLLVAIAAGIAPARAEKHVFIIASNPDGYGVDRCLAGGESCGNAAAAAYCHAHEFSQALSFRKAARDDITGALATGGGTGCRGAACDAYVAIECIR